MKQKTYLDKLMENKEFKEKFVKEELLIMEFKKYRRTNIAEMRPYVLGEDLTKISVADVDNPEKDMGMIARNPKNYNDQWYVARQYFEDNFEEV